LIVLPTMPAQEKPDKKDKAKRGEEQRDRKKKKGAEKREKESIATIIGNFTGVGRGHRDLIIPQRDKVTRKLTSRIKAHRIDRIDETTLRFQGLFVQKYTPEETEDLYIDVSSGTFDMETGMLIGNDTSVLGVPGKFEIIGGGLVCDTSEKEVDRKKVRSQVSIMEGPVKMTIFDSSSKKPGSSKRPARKPIEAGGTKK